MNTKRMNRLEELGRADSEKAFTKKGKKNLKAEKKRIVKELKKVPSGKKGKGNGTILGLFPKLPITIGNSAELKSFI